MGHPAPDDCRDPDDVTRLLGQLVDAGQQEPGQVSGVPGGPDVGRLGQLLGEERVALGPLGDGLHLLGAQPDVEPVHEGSDVAGVQWTEVQTGQARDTGPSGQGSGEWMTPVDIVASVGHEQGQRAAQASGEEQGEQVAGGLVGPVDVLDDHECRPVSSERLQGPVDGFEDRAACGGSCAS